MTILYLNLQITRSDIRPHIKCPVGLCLVVAYGHFAMSSTGICVGMYGLTDSLYHPKGAYKIVQLPAFDFDDHRMI